MGRGGKREGSGRKSAYEEAARAQLLAEMYYDPQDQEAIEKRITHGKYSIRDRHILNALEGEQNAITPLFNKLHPDKMEVKEDVKLKIDV